MENEEKNRSNIYKGKIGEAHITKAPTNACHQINIVKGKVGEPNLTKVPVNVCHKSNIFKKKSGESHLTKVSNLKENLITSPISIVNNLDMDDQNSVLNLNNAKNMSFKNTKTDLTKELSDVFMVKRSDFNDDELELLSNLQINPNTLKSKWEWMNNDLVEKYYRFVLGPYLFVNHRLRYDDFKSLGFESFLRKLERDGISFSKLKSSIPVFRDILETIFDRDELKIKIARVKKKLRELEKSGHDLPKPKLYSEVIRFLNLKKEQIRAGDFIPSLNNILNESPPVKSFFKGIKDKQKLKVLKQRVGLAVRNWIKTNSDLHFKNLQDLKNHFKSFKDRTERGLTRPELINLINVFINRVNNELLSRYNGDNRELLNNINFVEYSQFLTENNIDNNEILKIVLDKTTLMELFKIAKIYEGGHRWRQATRCLQTIGLAILKCPEYDSLKKELKDLTKLKATQISKLIRDYIPLLKQIKPDLNIDKWFYKNILFSYKKAEDLARDLGMETSGNPGIIEKPKNKERFDELAEVYSPTLVPLRVWCQDLQHERFNTNGNKLQQRHWCKKCKYDLDKRIKDIISKIVFIIENFQQQGLENNKILSQVLSESFIFHFSKEIKRTGFIHSTQILRIIQVISLALLSSPDYYSLNKNFKKLTNLSENQVWRNINEYIPLLGEIFPELDVDKWLLQPYSTIPRMTITQFENHLKDQIKAVDSGKIEPPLSVEEIRLETVQDDISKATASRLTHEILGENFDKYFQTYTQYDRATFIFELERILEDNYHLATDLVLKLYKLTDLEPNEFVKHFYPKASFLVKALNENVTFRRKDTVTRIKLFIDEYFTGMRSQRKVEALEVYFDYLYLKEKYLIDKNLPFDFIWLENRILNIKNPLIQGGLLNFFEDFGRKKHPLEIFNNEAFTRASLLKLKGDNKRAISVKKVLDYFKEDLRLIKSYSDSPLFRLCEICKEVNASNLVVDHPKILGRVLRDLYHAIAVEIPVLKKIFNKFITGHIDILFYDGLYLIIGDYKRNLREIKEGFLQLTVYAMLLRKMLSEYSPEFENINIKCIGFCEELAIEFNPKTLGPQLLKFIESENKVRRLEGLPNLQTVPTRTLKITKDLFEELSKTFY